MSFSRIVDENNIDPYPALLDKNFVMNNTPTVLTRLILNGMIVKGQQCNEDPELRISDLAKLLL